MGFKLKRSGGVTAGDGRKDFGSMFSYLTAHWQHLATAGVPNGRTSAVKRTITKLLHSIGFGHSMWRRAPIYRQWLSVFIIFATL